jgi:3D (Asp-Asp-Asp) domain-containing protein
MRRNSIIGAATIVVLFVSQVVTASQPMSKVRLDTRTEIAPIEYDVKYVFSRLQRRGTVKKETDGKNGQVTKTYTQIFIDGKLAEEKLSSTERVEPVKAVFLMGPDGYQVSRGGEYTRNRVSTMKSTAYTPSAGRGSRATFRTATGRKAEYGIVAVDPKVIPLHTLVFVEGYGFAVAADTGGAIKGNIIDVCLPTDGECRKWGRKEVRVHVFREKLEPVSKKK